MNLRVLGGLFLMLFLTLGMSSCGEDDVTGCTDPSADNYNPEATVSDGSCDYSGCTDPDAENYDAQANIDDGTCVYARDKFIGSYSGSFTCPGPLALISGTDLSFTISEGLDPTKKNEVIVTLMNITGLGTLDLTATANGDELNISVELLGVPVLGQTANVTGTGTATLDAGGSVINAVINMEVASSFFSTTDTCTLIGTKQ